MPRRVRQQNFQTSMSPLALIAAGLGVPSGVRCPCGFCGESIFGLGTANPSGAVFALRSYPTHDVICAGCEAILAGKPGREPPPLRMRNVLVVGGLLTHPNKGDLRDVVLSPPFGLQIISASLSGHKHHVLHAGICDEEVQRWGTDECRVDIRPTVHAPILHGVEAMLAYHRREHIRLGQYLPMAIVRQGAAHWQAIESLLAQHRGSRAFDLLCWLAVKADKEPQGETTMNDDEIRTVQLLVAIARGSKYRSKDGIGFWNTYLLSRIRRHLHRPLSEMISRILDDCKCPTLATSTLEVVRMLDSYTDAQCVVVTELLRSRAALLVAMAYDHIKKEKCHA